MKHLVAAFAALGASTSVAACPYRVPLEASDVRYADTVVVGRITNYRIVSAGDGSTSSRVAPALRTAGRRSDYARFDVFVEEVLLGEAAPKLSVTWDNSTFAEPDKMPEGSFLVALRSPRAAIPPLRAPSAYVGPSPDPDLPTVLQAPCSAAFVFKSTDSKAIAVRKILGLPPVAPNSIADRNPDLGAWRRYIDRNQR